MVVTDRTGATGAIEAHPLFREPVVAPDDLAEQAAARGWPAALLDRALSLRVSRADIEVWLRDPRSHPTA